jgi:autophagy-related protein 2
VTTAADDFLHEELDAYEEAELDRSIRQSLVLEQNDPFSRDDIPGAFPGFASSPGGPSSPLPPTVESTTVLAGLVERILARLEFKVKCARIKIRHEDGKHGGVFELRIGGVRYADETDAGEEEGSRHTVRAIKLSSIEVYMLPLSTVESPPQPRFFPSMSRSSSSSSTSSVSTPSSTGNADMYMSQAVADLRQSSTSGVGSDASVYQSALSERIAEEEPSSETASRSKSRSRSVTPTGAARTASKEVLLLSFGTEDVSFRIQTTRPQLPEAPPASSERKISIETTRTSSRPRLFRASTSFNTSSLSALDLELSIGTVAVMVLPSQAATILSALQIACQGGVHNNPSEMPSDPNEVVQARVNAKVRLKAIHLALVYDLRASDSPSLAAAAKQYWAQPRTTSVPYGHLKFRLEGLEIAYASKGYVPKSAPSRSERGLSAPSAVHGTTGSARYGPRPPTVTVDLTDATIFEYLATKAPDPRADLEDSPPGGTFPVLIFDSNLSKQYDVAPGAHSVPFAARVPSKTAQSAFPDFESVDWRNSGVQRREGTAKAWKVRQKGRGVLKGTINTSPEQEGPVVMARKELSSTASKQVDPSTGVMLRPTAVAVVDLQPVHVFFDLSLVERLLPMLRSIAPAVRSASSDKNTPLELHTPRLASANLPAEHMSHYVIDDLDAQASSLSTLTPTRLPSELLRIRCPVVRLDIRCPAPPDRRGTWGDGAHLRSGIVTLDIHGIDANVRQSSSPSQPPSAKRVHSQVSEHVNYTKSNPAVRVQWQKMMLFFCRVPGKYLIGTQYTLTGHSEESFRLHRHRSPSP